MCVLDICDLLQPGTMKPLVFYYVYVGRTPPY